MSWIVTYSAHARQDLRDIYEYIARQLQAPGTASALAGRIMQAIRELDEMPERYPVYGDEPWRSAGLRFFSVGSYLVFYCLRREENAVIIVRIMYARRDISTQLDG